MKESKAYEVARETLKQLTLRKLVPTPANYRSLYNEIGGLSAGEAFPMRELKEIAHALPAKTPGQVKQLGLLESAIDRMQWNAVKTALVAYGSFSPALASVKSLQESSAGAPAITAEFLAQIGKLIEYMQPALGGDDSHFAQLTSEILQSLRLPDTDVVAVKRMLTNYSHRMSFVAEEQAEIRNVLRNLLQMVFENIGDISVEEQWLKGQMDALMLAAAPPLSLRRLDDVERRLRDVICKQKDAKERTVQAQVEMRQMLASFIDRLSEMTESTGSYHVKLEDSARQIEQAKSIIDIAPVLKDVVSATRNMALNSQVARDELHSMRERAHNTQAEIEKLHQELDRVSSLARHDALTGALNRKGLEEALEREIATVRRKETPLCTALLDIDNFKNINDAMGHATGDQALQHLAQVAQQCMRPQDILARFGGEEFVILLPDTALDKGIEAMTRLQRELTKRFFMAGTEKILITFSAGVAQVGVDEAGMDAIRRADQAMYLAKRAGKNRVLGA